MNAALPDTSPRRARAGDTRPHFPTPSPALRRKVQPIPTHRYEKLATVAGRQEYRTKDARWSLRRDELYWLAKTRRYPSRSQENTPLHWCQPVSSLDAQPKMVLVDFEATLVLSVNFATARE
jgi:hypothetical protein